MKDYNAVALQLLVHIDVRAETLEPYFHLSAPAIHEALDELCTDGLIERDGTRLSGFRSTPKGREVVDHVRDAMNAGPPPRVVPFATEPEAPDAFWVVWDTRRERHGVHYATKKEARDHAAKCAEANPGVPFIVMRAELRVMAQIKPTVEVDSLDDPLPF